MEMVKGEPSFEVRKSSCQVLCCSSGSCCYPAHIAVDVSPTSIHAVVI